MWNIEGLLKWNGYLVGLVSCNDWTLGLCSIKTKEYDALLQTQVYSVLPTHLKFPYNIAKFQHNNVQISRYKLNTCIRTVHAKHKLTARCNAVRLLLSPVSGLLPLSSSMWTQSVWLPSVASINGVLQIPSNYAYNCNTSNNSKKNQREKNWGNNILMDS